MRAGTWERAPVYWRKEVCGETQRQEPAPPQMGLEGAPGPGSSRSPWAPTPSIWAGLSAFRLLAPSGHGDTWGTERLSPARTDRPQAGREEPVSQRPYRGDPSDCPLLPEDEARPGFGSRGWKECWLWKAGPSSRLRSGEGLQRTRGGSSRLCCDTGFRATATGGRVQSRLSPFSGS